MAKGKPSKLQRENAELKEEVRKLTACPSCDGVGRRWYAGYGTDTCHECHGTGKRK